MSETFLIDTNVLVYAVNRESKYHLSSSTLLNKALNSELDCAISINNLFEFFAVVTDKKRVEKPLDIEQTSNIIKLISKSGINVINSDVHILNKALDIAIKKQKSNQIIFDFIIAATMLVYNIKYIATYNIKDFKDIKGIEALKPEDILKLNSGITTTE